MIKHLGLPARDACEALGLILGCAGGSMPVWLDGSLSAGLACDVGDVGVRLWERSSRWDERRSLQVEVGLPVHGHAGRDEVVRSPVLWAWTQSQESLTNASRLKPAPTMVMRFGIGASRLLLWSLKKPLGWAQIEPSNRRISYRIRGSGARAAPETLRVPVPGTFLRVGRTVPVPVLLTRLDLGCCYDYLEVVGRLKDAPDKNAWRKRK